eukprot:EG_transcript_25518
MKVENLEVPQHSSVREVARIQTAFQVLVLRLAEYKSYIPAGLFEQEEEGQPTTGQQAEAGGANADSDAEDSAAGPSHRLSAASHNQHRPSATASSGSAPRSAVLVSVRKFSTMSTSTHRTGGRRPAQSARKNVVVLAVNVMGFMDVLCSAAEGNIRNIFNDYLSLVHEATSQHRGNVDCVLGDQVFVTFNAHIPCSDSAGSAVAAALEVRQKLLHKLGDKLKFQVGASFGPVFAGSVGYTKFKSMACAEVDCCPEGEVC